MNVPGKESQLKRRAVRQWTLAFVATKLSKNGAADHASTDHHGVEHERLHDDGMMIGSP
jgi:hypothetical protein